MLSIDLTPSAQAWRPGDAPHPQPRPAVPTLTIATAMLEQLDADHDGTISFDEYCAIAAPLYQASGVALRAAFDFFDADRSGYIEMAELETVSILESAFNPVILTLLSPAPSSRCSCALVRRQRRARCTRGHSRESLPSPTPTTMARCPLPRPQFQPLRSPRLPPRPCPPRTAPHLLPHTPHTSPSLQVSFAEFMDLFKLEGSA